MTATTAFTLRRARKLRMLRLLAERPPLATDSAMDQASKARVRQAMLEWGGLPVPRRVGR